MRLLRAAVVLLLLGAAATAGDVVHLRNGGVLRGTVVAEDEEVVVLDLGGGVVRVPRARVRLVERGVAGEPAPRLDTRRDDWFLVLHRGKVVGWRREVVTAGAERLTVEERTVFFRPGGGEDVSIRRVETSDLDGTPCEFLRMETYGDRTEIVTGQHVRGRTFARVLRDGVWRAHELDLPEGWQLALPAWSRFLEEAAPGESRTVAALDLRRLAVREIVLRRDTDAAPPEGAGVRPCHAIRLLGDVRPSRALYRPGEGTLAVELNGTTLVARRSTRERVELAREANRGPDPLRLEDALRYPFHERPKSAVARHARAGLRLEAPDPGWTPEVREADEGLVLSFEKVGLFASLEVFSYPVDDAVDADGSFERALARLKLSAEAVEARGPVRAGEQRGLPFREVVLDARHRGEDLRCLLRVVRAPGRYVALVGASPERFWRWAEDDLRKLAASLRVAE